MDVKCRLADLNVLFNVSTGRLSVISKLFADNFEKPDICITATESDIDRERLLIKDEPFQKPRGTLELTVVHRILAEQLPAYDAAVLHSCAFSVDDKGIAFGAYSGTGKSTHMFLWQKLLGDRMTIVNGDKPLIRFIDDNLYMYGSPWAGKESLKANIKVPLTDICRIVRSETNFTKAITKKEGIDLLFKQIYMPFDAKMRLKTLELIERISSKVNFWEIHCNMEPDAAKVAYNTIFNKSEEN